MIIFFDAEFSGLIVDPKLISIGLIAEDGEPSFYAELSDTWNADECDFFVQDEILPLLDGGDCRMTKADLRQRLSAWLTEFAEPVQLATDSLEWDWPFIQQLLGTPRNWPANIEKTPLLLNTEHEGFETAIEDAYSAGLRRHHALDDAEANRQGWLAAGKDTEC